MPNESPWPTQTTDLIGSRGDVHKVFDVARGVGDREDAQGENKAHDCGVERDAEIGAGGNRAKCQSQASQQQRSKQQRVAMTSAASAPRASSLPALPQTHCTATPNCDAGTCVSRLPSWKGWGQARSFAWFAEACLHRCRHHPRPSPLASGYSRRSGRAPKVPSRSSSDCRRTS